ncbi:MAG: bifunctional acyl-ACP--phospholipid O-acyltransferase/long-chain-fatty-acid--ACP ligase [Acidobacteria bacterium]|nr:bifunctional acyl-ACP--phospholipid O-acyltransferase/long-chain-fatty-acid--ACP ligase [Acidobacteriota bacterium]
MLRAFVRLLLRLLYRVEVHGDLLRTDRLLIVSNHESFIDVVLLGAFLPVMPVWFIHTVQARRWFIRPILRFVPHVVVDTTKPWAMKDAISLIEEKRPVLIFPEGRLTETGSLMKIYDGPAFVAARTGATVVPVHIHGAVYSRFSRISGDFPKKLFPRITITIGGPRTIPMPEGPTARVRRHKAVVILRKLMQESAAAAREDTTLFAALLDAIGIYGRRRNILNDMRQQLSYHGLLKSSLALGRLVAKFSRQGEYVGVLMPNVSTTVSLLFGILAMRRVPAVLNFTSGADGMQSACRLANVRTVITSRAFLEQGRLAAAVEALRDVRIVCLEDLRGEFKLRDKLWLIGWALWFPRKAAARGARPEDPAAVLFTSGSEGKPKGVVLSHRSILANTAQIKSVIEFAPKDKFLSALPLFHAFGLTIGMFLPLLNGSRVVLYPSPLHYRLIPEIIYDRDCTVLFATNTFLAHYGKLANPFDFHLLRLVVSGAEKLTDDVRELYFEKFGIRIFEGYGATECSPVVTANTPMACRFGTVGSFLPLVEHRIEPVAGLESGGVLHVRGPNVMLGYLRGDHPGEIEPPRSAFGEGWYNTGDAVATDEDGFVRILGRMKRFAKIAGEMVSLETAERIAGTASPGYEHASITLPEPDRGEMIVLFTTDPALRREQLQQRAREMRLPEIAVPRRIIKVEEFPLLGNGKKDYVTLDRRARELMARPAGKA